MTAFSVNVDGTASSRGSAQACLAGQTEPVTAVVTFGADGILATLAPGSVHLSSSTISVALCDRLAEAHAAARGYSVDAMIGRSDLQLLAPALARQQLADDAYVMESRHRKTTEEWASDQDRGVWMETYKAAVIDEDGTVLGTVGAARDISDGRDQSQRRLPGRNPYRRSIDTPAI